jgi:hypothetical protein
MTTQELYEHVGQIIFDFRAAGHFLVYGEPTAFHRYVYDRTTILEEYACDSRLYQNISLWHSMAEHVYKNFSPMTGYDHRLKLAVGELLIEIDTLLRLYDNQSDL